MIAEAPEGERVGEPGPEVRVAVVQIDAALAGAELIHALPHLEVESGGQQAVAEALRQVRHL